MKGFHRIAENIRDIFEPLTKRYGFGILIHEYRLELANKTSKILFTTERYYPDIFAYIIDLNASEFNIYRLRHIISLRGISFNKPKLDSDKDDDDDCRIEFLELVNKILSENCLDMLNGDFSKIKHEGYWEVPDIREDYESIKIIFSRK